MNDDLAESPVGQGRLRAGSVCCGTTVELHPSRHPGVAAPETAAAGPTGSNQAWRGETVGVAEDEPALRDGIVAVPADFGYATRQTTRPGPGRD